MNTCVFLQGAFKPIIHGKEDIIREMVYGYVPHYHMVAFLFNGVIDDGFS